MENNNAANTASKFYTWIRHENGIDQTPKPVTLTTDHASSSYGQPVAIIDGVAYGVADFPGLELEIGNCPKWGGTLDGYCYGDSEALDEEETALFAKWNAIRREASKPAPLTDEQAAFLRQIGAI